MTAPLLEATGLTKRFGSNVVLNGVDLSVGRGEVHAIVGENGAGKSTLIKILGGVHRADGGTVRLDGRGCSLASPQAALDSGIVVIHQELSLAPHLNTVENIFLRRAELGRDRVERTWDKRQIFLEAVDERTVGRVEIVSHAAAVPCVEIRAPVCLKQRIEKSARCAAPDSSGRRAALSSTPSASPRLRAWIMQ